MSDEKSSTTNVKIVNKGVKNQGVGSGIYGLAFIGSLIYYLMNAETFWMGVLGFLKALVWPAILVYGLLDYLKM